MSYKIVHGSLADDTVLQQIIFEGINEMVQDATYPTGGLDMTVTEDDAIIYAVDEKDQDIVGVLCYKSDRTTAEISLIYVEPSSRRQHIATQMVNALDTKMIGRGLTRKSTSIHAANAVARMALNKLGFVVEVLRLEANVKL